MTDTDILSFLEELERSEENKSSRPSSVRASARTSTARPQPKNNKLPSSYVSEGARKTRPTSRPPPLDDQTLRLPTAHCVVSERSPSIGGDSLRRVSFAEAPRPVARRLWIPTKTESLASGFVYDPRLNKYSVSEEEWKQFNKEITAAADVRSPTWMWPVQRKNVIKKVAKDLQYVESSYDGDVKRVLKKFNNFWKNKKGFTVWLELPTAKGHLDLSDDLVGDTPEDKEKARRDAKRFRVVVASVDKDSKDGRAASVYSRNSSISKSIRGEGTGVMHDDLESATDLDSPTEDEIQQNTLDVPSSENENAMSPISPMSDYQDADSHADPNEMRSPTFPTQETAVESKS